MSKASPQQKSLLRIGIEFFLILLLAFLIRTFGYGLYRVPSESMEPTMLIGEFFFAHKLPFGKFECGDIISFNDPLFNYSNNKFLYFVQRYVYGASSWTKRIIGVPGDTIAGVIENEKMVIYRNGKKIDEPYINRYPLIGVWNVDLHEVQKKIKSNPLSVDQLWSYLPYDKEKEWHAQPWYAIKKERVMRDAHGNLIIKQNKKKSGLKKSVKKLDNKFEQKENYWTSSDEFLVKLGANQYWVMGDNRLNSQDSRSFGPINGNLIHGKIIYRIASVDNKADWIFFDMLVHPVDFWHSVRWQRCGQQLT